MDRPCFSAMAWKLFHSAIILLGRVGVSTVTESRATVRPLGSGPANMSPSWTVITSPSRVPNPVSPAISNLIQRFMAERLLTYA